MTAPGNSTENNESAMSIYSRSLRFCVFVYYYPLPSIFQQFLYPTTFPLTARTVPSTLIPATMPNSPYLLDSIVDVLITTLYTASVRDAVPVSLLLVADSGTAKSKLLKSMSGKSLHHTDSFSSQGLFTLMQNDQAGEIRWIIVPDLNPTLSRPAKTVSATVANLLTLTMDGTCRVDDGRSEKLMKHKPIGMISAVTPDMWQKQAKRWFALGLTRRIIPIFYEYSLSTVEKLKAIVRDGQISGNDFPANSIPSRKELLPAMPKEEALQIDSIGTQLAINLGMTRGKSSDGKLAWWSKKIVPISPIVLLRTMACANAIKHNRGSVNESDIQFLISFLEFTNPQSPKQL